MTLSGHCSQLNGILAQTYTEQSGEQDGSGGRTPLAARGSSTVTVDAVGTMSSSVLVPLSDVADGFASDELGARIEIRGRYATIDVQV